MQTITFYSYNGGTGRTLAVANAAKYLVRLGQKVFAIDMDLEAPGLHYKLGLGTKTNAPLIVRGLVDYVHTFVRTKAFPDSLADHTVQIQTEDGRNDHITLMPAGNVPCAEYWHKLTQINWHELFYSQNPEGIPFFLELKARIEKEFAPDFLLIDSRTGITEIGGIATTILPDRVVCLLLKNNQNLEGTREVMRGIATAHRLDSKPAIGIIPVLSRIPWSRLRHTADFEEKALDEVKATLCQKSSNSSDALNFQEVFVLHSEDNLQYHESLRIGGQRTVDQSPLLRDYLRLFSTLIPSETVEPRLEKIIGACMEEMIDRPEKVQNDLEALTQYCPHAKSFLALLKYYRVRNVSSEKLLRAAAGYWDLSRDSNNPLLWEIVDQHFRVEEGGQGRKAGELSPEFIEDVWSHAGSFDVKTGLRLADLHFALRDEQEAVRVLMRLIQFAEPKPIAIVATIRKLISRDQFKLAGELVETYRTTLLADAEFQTAWAQLIVKTRDSTQAKELVDTKEFRPAKLQAEDSFLYVQLISLSGQTEELNAALRNALDQALVDRDMTPKLMEIGSICFEIGKHDLFRQRVQQVLGKRQADRVLGIFERQGPRLGYKRLFTP